MKTPTRGRQNVDSVFLMILITKSNEPKQQKLFLSHNAQTDSVLCEVGTESLYFIQLNLFSSPQ